MCIRYGEYNMAQQCSDIKLNDWQKRWKHKMAVSGLTRLGINNECIERKETKDQLYSFLDCGKTHLLT